MKLLLHKHWARLDAYAFAQFLSSMGYEITLEGVIVPKQIPSKN